MTREEILTYLSGLSLTDFNDLLADALENRIKTFQNESAKEIAE